MFLSHMRLNAARRGTRYLMASPQRMHAAVLQAFPGIDAAAERVLWRIDRPARHDVNLLIVSPRQPDLTHVVEQAGWPASPEPPWRTREYSPLLDRLAVGQLWRFRLRANPVIRRREAGGRVQTIPHLTVAQQEVWLAARAESIGVEFVGDGEASGICLTERRSDSFVRREASPGHGRDVTIASAQFDGLLRVVDPETLRRSLTQGVGRAKAYGCGLLTLTTPRP